MSSYDSYHHQQPHKQSNLRLGPNAHDDLKCSIPELKSDKLGTPPATNGHTNSSRYNLTNNTPETQQSPRNSLEMQTEQQNKIRSADVNRHHEMYR